MVENNSEAYVTLFYRLMYYIINTLLGVNSSIHSLESIKKLYNSSQNLDTCSVTGGLVSPAGYKPDSNATASLNTHSQTLPYAYSLVLVGKYLHVSAISVGKREHTRQHTYILT